MAETTPPAAGKTPRRNRNRDKRSNNWYNRSGNNNKNNNNGNNGTSNRRTPNQNRRRPKKKNSIGIITDEDALLQFTPLLRSGKPEHEGAVRIHEEYSNGGMTEREFISAVKDFLGSSSSRNNQSSGTHPEVPDEENTKPQYDDADVAADALQQKLTLDDKKNKNNNKNNANPSEVSKNDTGLKQKIVNDNNIHMIPLAADLEDAQVHDTGLDKGKAATTEHGNSPTPTPKPDANADTINAEGQEKPEQTKAETEGETESNHHKNDTATTTKKIRQPKRINYRPRGIIRLKSYRLGGRAEFDAFWELECACFDDYDDLHIGLFRLGTPENTTQSSIVSKPLSYNEFNNNTTEGGVDTLRSRTHFHTPRIPGYFTLRIFSPSNPVQTLASLAHGVLIVTVNVCEGVKFVIGTLLRKSGNNNSSNHAASSVTSQSTSGVMNASMVLDGLTSGSGSSSASGCERSIYGCVRECGKVVSGVCREYELISAKVAAEQEKEQEQQTEDSGDDHAPADDDNAQQHTTEEQEGEAKQSSSGPSAALKKLLVERSVLERKLVEVHYHYSQMIKKCIQHRLFNATTLQNLQEQLEGFCPVRELFMTMFRKQLNSLQQRQQQHQHLNIFYPEKPIPCPVPQAISGTVLKLLSDEIVAASRANASAVQEANSVKEAAYKQVCLAVDHVLPGVGIRVFGSSVNGFGTAGSDLDLSLTATPTSTQLTSLAAYIEDQAPTMSNLDSSRLTARIPILKFDVTVTVAVPINSNGAQQQQQQQQQHVIQVDLSPSNTLAQINTKLLHTYSLHPMASAIMLLLKRLVRKYNVNNPSEGSLSTYAYVLMVIHYLQTVKVLPDLQSLAYLRQTDVHGNVCNAQIVRPNTPPHVPLQHPHSPHYVCNVYFLCPNNRVEYDALMKLYGASNVSASDVGFHFVNFLYYFVNQFDYRRDVVSITKNDPDFANYASAATTAQAQNAGDCNDAATAGLASYAKLLKCEHWPESFTTKHNTLSVADPLEKFYDVSHVLKNSQWLRIRKVFADALERLCAYGTASKGDCDAKSAVQVLLGTDEP